MNWVWDHSRSKNGARLVLLAIADCGEYAWPSIAELARKTQLKDRAVQNAITELVRLGELKVGFNEGPRGCNRYHVIMDAWTPEDVSAGQTADPRRFCTPANSAPPQNSTGTPADSAGGTVREPEQPPTGVASLSHPSDRDHDRKSSGPDEPGSRPDVERLCNHLADLVEQNYGKRPVITRERWRKPARLMLDKDGYTEDQITRAIDWCQDDEFWRPNVRSMGKLRDKYIQLREAAKRKARQNGNGHGAVVAKSDERMQMVDTAMDEARRMLENGGMRALMKGNAHEIR